MTRKPVTMGALLSGCAVGLKQIQPLLWWLAIASIVAVRCGLTAHDEIVPIRDDSTNYARYTLHYLDSSVPLGLPPQSPGLPILAMAGRALGIPYKLWLDALFILASWYVADRVRQLTHSRVGGLALFASFMLNPWFMNHSILFLSEPPTAVVLVVLATAVGPYLLRPSRRWTWSAMWVAAAASIAYALLRPEWPVLLSFWIVILAAVLFRRRKDFWRAVTLRGSWRVALVALPIVLTFIALSGVRGLHQAAYGVAALSITESPGLRSLMNSLYRIPPEQMIRYAPVTYQSMSLACDACPTLNAVRETLLDRQGPNYQAAKRRLELDGEFGTWLNWLLVEAFGGSNAQTEAAMKQAALEIRQAQRDGRLGCRSARFPVDPLWREWWGDIPNTVWQAVTHAFEPNHNYLSSPRVLAGRLVTDPIDRAVFADALLLRAGTVPQAVTQVRGILHQPHSRYATVEFVLKDRVVAEAGIEPIEPGRAGFELRVPALSGPSSLKECFLEFVTGSDPSDRSAPVPLSDHLHHSRREINLNERIAQGPGPLNEVWFLSTRAPAIDLHAGLQTRQALIRFWPIIHGALLATMVLLGAARPATARQLRAVGWLLLIVAAFCFGRLAFVALIEVWLKWGLHRYAETNHLLSLLLLALLAFWVSAVCRFGIRRSWRPRPATVPRG